MLRRSSGCELLTWLYSCVPKGNGAPVTAPVTTASSPSSLSHPLSSSQLPQHPEQRIVHVTFQNVQGSSSQRHQKTNGNSGESLHQPLIKVSSSATPGGQIKLPTSPLPKLARPQSLDLNLQDLFQESKNSKSNSSSSEGTDLLSTPEMPPLLPNPMIDGVKIPDALMFPGFSDTSSAYCESTSAMVAASRALRTPSSDFPSEILQNSSPSQQSLQRVVTTATAMTSTSMSMPPTIHLPETKTPSEEEKMLAASLSGKFSVMLISCIIFCMCKLLNISTLSSFRWKWPES